MGWVQVILIFLRSLLRSQAELAAEKLFLRQQGVIACIHVENRVLKNRPKGKRIRFAFRMRTRPSATCDYRCTLEEGRPFFNC